MFSCERQLNGGKNGCEPVVHGARCIRLNSFFFASDRDEPQHVHVEREDNVAKFWLDPVRLQSSGGFSRVEIGRIQKLVSEHQLDLMGAWNEYFRG